MSLDVKITTGTAGYEKYSIKAKMGESKASSKGLKKNQISKYNSSGWSAAYYDALKEAYGDAWYNTGLCFVGEYGKKMHPDSITHWLKKFTKKHGLNHVSPLKILIPIKPLMKCLLLWLSIVVYTVFCKKLPFC